ncbi:TadE family type IV pilus minor pilin [Leifsonia poae]|uniref:TadE family type IV pilus minor pilin n=1 Tax=Leifsonia poae TaxID=110933 RepID=UPI001CBD4CDD|nr:TadE family type IV pilus minor pilin [Leifsonia poae]
MTAEFAVVLPAVLMCLALCVGAIQAVAQQVRLTQAAAVAARMLGRGDDPGAVVTGAGAAGYESRQEGKLICVRIAAASGVTGLGAIGVVASAQACAANERSEEDE